MFQKIADFIYKHLITRNSLSFSLYEDLIELVKQKDSFIQYIKSEYSVSLVYNLLMTITIINTLYKYFSVINSIDIISLCWLVMICYIKILETIPKLFLIWEVNRINNQRTNDANLCMRRLIKLIRSNVFLYNTVLAYSNLFCYTIYFLFIKRNSKYNDNASQIYLNINFIMNGFFFRIILTLINYHFHFKYGVNQADLANIDPFAENQKIDKEIFEKIKGITLNKEEITVLNQENEGCCICLNGYSEGECVKILPCNIKHIFHSKCIETWLSNNVACPTCRKVVQRESITA
jgi:hypothetical protein